MKTSLQRHSSNAVSCVASSSQDGLAEHTRYSVRDNSVRMTVNDAHDRRVLFIYLTMDISLYVTCRSRDIHGGSVGHVILHKIPLGSDGCWSHVSWHNEDIRV
jgi:hypothetical protein